MSKRLNPVREKEFQSSVVELAKLGGWLIYHTYRSTKSPAGFPDLVLVRERVLYRELKLDHTYPSEAQKGWLAALEGAGADVAVWRPRDWPDIERELLRPTAGDSR